MAFQLQKLLHDIVYRALPLATASALAVTAIGACECPDTTRVSTQTVTLGAADWARALEQSDNEGLIPSEACEALCTSAGHLGGASISDGYATVRGCRLAPSANTDGEADAAGSMADGANADTASADARAAAEPAAADAGSAPDAPGGQATAEPTAPETEPAGAVVCTFEQTQNCGGVGRRPAALSVEPALEPAHPVGAYFAEAAALEAGAVRAFQILVDDLRRLRAPRALIERAETARREEVEHVRLTANIARKYATRPRRSSAPAGSGRPLVELALENAVEGCVAETWGALLVTWQAEMAQDPDIRAAMAQIAADETRHAELSWDLDRWMRAQLSDTERATVEAATRSALADMKTRLERPRSPELVTLAGLPTPDVAQTLFSELMSRLPS